MKTNLPKAKKEVHAPRLDWHQPIYSEIALKMMEQATGQRYAPLAAPVTPPRPPVTDPD